MLHGTIHVFIGRRHGEAIHVAVTAGVPKPVTREMQGFVDEEGNFYTRKEARDHAVCSQQIRYQEDRDGKGLVSEELW